jgi:hypothetical protein
MTDETDVIRLGEGAAQASLQIKCNSHLKGLGPEIELIFLMELKFLGLTAF